MALTKQGWIMIGGLAGLLVVAGIVSSAVGHPLIAPTPTASNEAFEGTPVQPAQTDQPVQPDVVETPDAPPTSDLAARTQTALLAGYGVNSFTDLLSTLPGSLAGTIASIDSPSTGTVVITVQVTKDDTSRSELDAFARASLSLVGQQVPDLDRVEAVTADSLLRGVANRRDIPLLNR